MKHDRIQGKLGLLFWAFFALVIVAVSVTFWSLESQQQDALTINLAGRQRMLAQQMARQALEMSLGDREATVVALNESIQIFDQTLVALQNGGAAPYLPGRTVDVQAARDDSVRDQLARIHQTWLLYQDNLENILNSDPASPAFLAASESTRALSAQLLEQSDGAVRLYEQISNQKLSRLRWIQAIFLVCALILLGSGGWIVRRSILYPVQQLQAVAERIGQGNLDTPVEVAGPGEVRSLAENLESMRGQLKGSQAELLAWTESLEQRVSQRTRELEALHTVSQEITSRLDIQSVLGSITHKTRDLLNTEVVFLCLLDESGQTMHLQATNNGVTAIQNRSASVDNPTVDKVLSGEQALRCDEQGCHCSCTILAPAYHASHVAAPLKIGEKVIGALCVGSTQPGSLPDDALEVLTKLANVAAVALENARLYEQAERAAALEERQRIAAEMHDGLAQTLSYLKLAVDQAALKVENQQNEQAAGILEQVHSSLDLAVDDTRRAIASLQEQGPLYSSLQDRLDQMAADFSTVSMPVHWNCTLETPLLLDQQHMEHVLRVVREALLNAQKHSQATQVTIALEQNVTGELCVRVEDDGVGFDPQPASREDERRHFGLNIMQARAARIGGRFELQAAPNAGTHICLSWPANGDVG